MLCKKVVNFFSLLSHTHESGARRMGITQDLLSLVTGLAHYLKILIRIALTAALKLERDYSSKSALSYFLSRLDRLCKDPEALKSPTNPNMPEGSRSVVTAQEGPKMRPYGYKSLARLGDAVIGQGDSISDLCEKCQQTVEEECVRLGTNSRWHLHCLCCSNCKRHACKEKSPIRAADGVLPALHWKQFRLEYPIEQLHKPVHEDGRPTSVKPGTMYCSECPSSDLPAQEGFEYVSRLEQYAFLLCVALNKLYRLLKQRGVMPSLPRKQPL